MQRTVNVAGKLDLFGMDFNRLDLLTLQGVQAVVRHELGWHGNFLFLQR
ncbi:hypothetical protein V5O39_00880 [Pseudomonas parakoreensis]